MSATDHVDGTAEEIGTELAPVEAHPPANLFRTDDPVEVVVQASRVAEALKAVIVAQKLYENIQGKSHVKVEGWQLVGAMLGVTAVCVATEPVDGGWKATVEARAADGRVIGRADAMCTKFEKRGPWKTADDYARLSMAQTRATSKALKGPLGFVVSLAGYATTPAEEMTFAEPDPVPPPTRAVDDKPITAAARGKIARAIGESGMDPAMVLGAAGFASIDDVSTVSAAMKVRAVLDDAKAVAS
jgi:hypothetical protein